MGSDVINYIIEGTITGLILFYVITNAGKFDTLTKSVVQGTIGAFHAMAN